MMATPSERHPELDGEHEGVSELVRGARVDDPLNVGLSGEMQGVVQKVTPICMASTRASGTRPVPLG